MTSSKKLTCKGPLQQVFIRIYGLEIKSVRRGWWSEYGVLGLRQINTCRKVTLQIIFFLMTTLPSISLIFLRLQQFERFPWRTLRIDLLIIRCARTYVQYNTLGFLKYVSNLPWPRFFFCTKTLHSELSYKYYSIIENLSSSYTRFARNNQQESI